MKILVVCQHYAPEPFRITDICESLVQKGHEVSVITGLPNYPEGKIYAGYKSKSKRTEMINGVRVRRCFTIGRRSGILFRLLNYYSFAFFSARYARRLREKFDVVFVNQLSPVMMACPGVAYKKKHGVKMALYCLDLWPDSLCVGGIKKSSFLYRIFHKISAKIYKKADKIFVSSQSFSEYFQKEFGIAETEYLPQYAESLFDAKICEKQPNESLDIMFAGNVGKAQSIDTIICAAQKTQDVEKMRWHIVGDGSELENAKKQCESLQLSNVIFHGRQPLEAMPAYYAMADVMLVTMQKNDVISKTLPGKVQTYMAAGKPLLGAIDGETKKVIEEAQCGLCCSAEDAEALSACARELAMAADLKQYAANALSYYEKHFLKETFLQKVETELESLIQN